MNLKEEINSEKASQHVAIIMDGNGRWARKRRRQVVRGAFNGVRKCKKQ